MSINIVNLSAYKAPEIVESNQKEWIEYGANNDYFSYLIDRYNASATHNAVINNICKLIYGRGMTAINASQKPNEYAQALALFSGEDIKKVITDRKMLGQFALQLHYDKAHKKVIKAYHIPVHLLRAEKCNKDGEIEAYYYSDNWSDTKKFPPQRINAFGFGKSEIEIYYYKPYSVGLKYYANPDYLAGLPYTELEERVSKYLNNLVKTSFSPKSIINFNNGWVEDEKAEEIKNKIMSQLTGEEGSQLIVSFNDSKEAAATVESLPVSDADKQYAYIAEEALRKILLSHNVTSPLLFGIATTTGFSSNADELKNSAILFDNMVIKPYQDEITSCFEEILNFNGIDIDLKFNKLNILEDGELTNKDTSKDTTLSSDEPSDEDFNLMLDELFGEVITNEWERFTEREVKESNSSVQEWVESSLNPKKSGLQKLASIIKSAPSRDSNLDKSVYKVRYEYAERYSKDNSRDFCVKMMERTKNGVVYRLEDIDKASRAGVNKSFGHKGQSYDLYKYKGGVSCGHYWNEILYVLKKKDGKYVEDKALSSSKEVDSIPKSYMPRPTGRKESQIAPIDMPNRGHHPNYMK